MSYKHRNCPVCGFGSGDSQKLFTQEFAAEHGVSLLQGYDVVICGFCGAGYADRIPPQETLDAYYRDLSKYEHQESGGRESEHDVARLRTVARIVEKAIPSRRAHILDIGCSTGALLALLKERGYENLLGLDPSPVCSTNAMRAYGIEVRTGALGDIASWGQRFDLLILSAVLEHVREVKASLKTLRCALVPGGQIFVSVPDATCFATAEDAPFQEFSTEHINYFSPISLENVMRSSGFRFILCEQNNYREGVGHGPTGATVDAVFLLHESPCSDYEKDTETEPALREYIRQSQAIDDRIGQTIDEILARNEPIVVWGVGTHTLRLLATSHLREARITAFVDSNPRYQGKDLNGAPIIPPEALGGMPEPILISSRVFQRSIVEQIREKLHLTNKLHLLYDL